MRLSVFILVWVFIFLAYQLFFHGCVGVNEGENAFVELVWTFIPILVIFLFGVLKIGCLPPDLSSCTFDVYKVVGRQWY
ncbi:hypothetical protein DKP78_19340 [Enterococcus faecium]|nr:hypothetical protein DKP78_19340 [Enterococcus faecium]